MASSLLGSLDSLISQPLVSTVASRLGENTQNVSRGLKTSATSILAGLAGKSGDSGAMSQAFSTITNPSNDFSALSDPAKLADMAQSTGGIGDTSTSFVNGLFGNKMSQITDLTAKASGLSGSSSSAIMRIAGPLVLGMLGKTVKDRGLGLSSFTSMLSGEKDDIMRAAPSGFSNLFGGQQGWSHDREVQYQETHGTRDNYGTHGTTTNRDTYRTGREEYREAYPKYRQDVKAPSSGRWIWPAVAALALLGLFWGARARSHRVTYDTATVGGEVVTPTTTPTTTPTVNTPIGAIALPGGAALVNAAPSGVESKLVAFLKDPAQPVGTTNWYDFDRLKFDNNTANISAESNEQIDNIAKVMQAYPNAKIKIGGFTDNVGSAAANKRLSSERASAVKAMLIKDGVAADRIQTEGYGQENPIADNSTEAGRAQNRRVSILVTGK